MSEHLRRDDPRAQIRADLLAAARRQAASRRRRRGSALVGGAIVALLATAAGAIALGGYTTGVPAIDETLRQSQEHLERHADRDGVPDLELRPGSGGASEPLEFDWLGDASRPWRAVAYVSRDGSICSVLAARDQSAPGTRTGHTCLGENRLRAMLDRAPAVALCRNPTSGRRGGELVVVVCGYARGEVERVRISGPQGTVDASLTPAWQPRSDALGPLRLFVGFAPTGIVRDPRERPDPDATPLGETIEVEAILPGGDAVDAARP